MTDEEKRAILNCIIYDKNLANHTGESILEWAQSIHTGPNGSVDKQWSGDWENSSGGMTAAEILGIANTIIAHPDTFGGMVIRDVSSRNIDPDPAFPNAETSASMATIVEGNEMTILYQGTNGDADWIQSDAPLADPLVTTSAEQQASAYLDEMATRFPGLKINTTGHSLGGHLAQYVAILHPELVNGAYSYDGPGFNTGFLLAHADAVHALVNRGALVTYANADDPVHFYLWHPGTSIHYESPHFSLGDFFRNHAPSALFNFGNGQAELRGTSYANPILSSLFDVVNVLVTQYPLLGYAAIYLYKWEKIKWHIDQVLNAALTAIKSGIKYIADAIMKALADAQTFLLAIGAAIRQAIEAAKAWITSVGQTIKNAVVNFTLEALSVAAEAVNALKEAVTRAGTAITEWVASTATAVAVKAQEIVTASIAAVKAVGVALMEGFATVFGNIASAVAGGLEALGNIFHGSQRHHHSFLVRDFSDTVLEKLENIVAEVTEEPSWDIRRWDIWYRVEDLFVGIDFPGNSTQLDSYYRKMIDMKGVSKQQIEQIFSDVRAEDHRYAVRMDHVKEEFRILNEKLRDLIRD